MAKRRKKKTDLGPLNAMIDVAGAVVYGAVVKHKVKEDYQKGHGDEVVRAATMVNGMGAMRRGTAGTLGLGGLIGVNSALKDIERMEQQKASARMSVQRYHNSDNWIDMPGNIRTNNNQYAWRLNCEDGSQYGVS